MSRQSRFICAALFGLVFLQLASGQAGSQPPRRGGCSVLDKTRPPLFISYERPTDKPQIGDPQGRGVTLRLSNNSDCVISLAVAAGTVTTAPASPEGKDGKKAQVPDPEIASLAGGQYVHLLYRMYYPNVKRGNIEGFGGDAYQPAWLKGGDHVLFSVPLINFKRGGVLSVRYDYDWEYVPAYREHEGADHYLSFRPERVPKEVLK